MTELSDDILSNLKCEICDGYLSYGPIRLKPDGGSVCGRCPLPEDEGIHNKPYEKLATMVSFPCRYQEDGCEVRKPFDILKQHEDSCEYRELICPVAPLGSCNWIGPRTKILQHCKIKHPKQILEHPCFFEHNITSNSLENYILSVYHMLFLIQTKVCVASRKIYHSVKLLGEPERASFYNYELEVIRRSQQIKQRKAVLPQGFLDLQEDSFLATDINSILAILGGLDGAKFKITLSMVLHPVICFLCRKSVLKPAFRDEKGWRCANCAPNCFPCNFTSKGCSYSDIANKKEKHNKYYCKFSTFCVICWSQIKNISIQEHYKIHAKVTHESAAAWRIKPNSVFQRHLVKCEVGCLICFYACEKENNGIIIRVWSPLRSNEISSYSCELRLTHPTNGKTLNRTLDLVYKRNNDWETLIKSEILNNVFPETSEYDMKIDLIKRVPFE